MTAMAASSNEQIEDLDRARLIRSLERVGFKPKIVPTPPPSLSILDHDTSAGAGGIFSPLPLWKGTDEDYLALMRGRYKDDYYRDAMLCCARYQLSGIKIAFRGPWATEARSILERLVTRAGT